MGSVVDGNIDRLMPSGLVIACSWFSSRAGRVPPDRHPAGAQEVPSGDRLIRVVEPLWPTVGLRASPSPVIQVTDLPGPQDAAHMPRPSARHCSKEAEWTRQARTR